MPIFETIDQEKIARRKEEDALREDSIGRAGADNIGEKIEKGKIIPGGLGRYSPKEIGADEEFQANLVHEKEIARVADEIVLEIEKAAEEIEAKKKQVVSGESQAKQELVIPDGLKDAVDSLKKEKGVVVAGEIIRKAGDKIISKSSKKGTNILKIFTALTRGF